MIKKKVNLFVFNFASRRIFAKSSKSNFACVQFFKLKKNVFTFRWSNILSHNFVSFKAHKKMRNKKLLKSIRSTKIRKKINSFVGQFSLLKMSWEQSVWRRRLQVLFSPSILFKFNQLMSQTFVLSLRIQQLLCFV